MENKLAEALVNKGVLPAGTEVEARHNVVGLGGVSNVTVTDHFTIAGTRIREDGKVEFSLLTLRNGQESRVFAENVLNIDGMDPIRFASVYNVTADGGKAILGKRRGRKPKNRRPEELDEF
jgi:hypothetical protein